MATEEQNQQKKKRQVGLVDIFNNGMNHGAGIPKQFASTLQYAAYLAYGFTAFQTVNMGFFSIASTIPVMGHAIPFTAAFLGGIFFSDLFITGVATGLKALGLYKGKIPVFPITKTVLGMLGLGPGRPTKQNPNPSWGQGAAIAGSTGKVRQLLKNTFWGQTGAQNDMEKIVGLLGKAAGLALAGTGFFGGAMLSPHLASIFTIYNTTTLALFAGSMGAIFTPMIAAFALNYLFKPGKPIKTLGLGLAAGVGGVAAASYAAAGNAVGASAFAAIGNVAGVGGGLTSAFGAVAGHLGAASQVLSMGAAALGAPAGAVAFMATSPLMPVLIAGALAFGIYKAARNIYGFRDPNKVAQKRQRGPKGVEAPA